MSLYKTKSTKNTFLDTAPHPAACSIACHITEVPSLRSVAFTGKYVAVHLVQH